MLLSVSGVDLWRSGTPSSVQGGMVVIRFLFPEKVLSCLPCACCSPTPTIPVQPRGGGVHLSPDGPGPAGAVPVAQRQYGGDRPGPEPLEGVQHPPHGRGRVTLARRSSRGGAVFHDLGNSCFTFMAGKPGYDKNVSTTIVIDALARLGVSALPPGATTCWWRPRTGSQGVGFGLPGRPMIAAFTTVPCCWMPISVASPTTSIPTPRSWRPRASAR